MRQENIKHRKKTKKGTELGVRIANQAGVLDVVRPMTKMDFDLQLFSHDVFSMYSMWI